MKRATAAPTTTASRAKSSGKGNPAATKHLLPRWSGTPVLCLALIAIIGLLAYSDTFRVPLVFDDEGSIIENPVIKNLASFLFDGAGYRYNPRRFIGYLTIALNYRLGGLDVAGYHIFNLAVHIISAWLVYFFLRLTLQTPFFRDREPAPDSLFTVHSGPVGSRSLIPLFAALLFVAHPLQTQAVTYVIQRLASLAAMFYLAALVCYVQARLRQETAERLFDGRICILYFLSLVAAVLAMKTKEIAFTLPIMLTFYEFSFFGATTKKRLLFLLPLVLTIVIVPLGLIHTGKPIGEFLSDVSEMARESKTISRGDYLLTQFSVIATYLRLLVFPVNQNLDYDYPIFHSLFTPRVFFSFLLLVSLMGVAVRLYYRSTFDVRRSTGDQDANRSPFIQAQLGPVHHSRLVAFGIIWFFVTLSVESSIIPISDVIFEHRLYLPSVGAFCAAATLFAIIAQRFSARTRALASMTVVLVLAAITWQRNLVWGSATGLWQDCIAKSPRKIRPYNNLANALTARGRIDEAIEQLRSALILKPDNANALRNLGAAYQKKGWLDAAIEQYRMSLAAMPNNMYTHYNLGVACAQKGLTDAAIEQFLMAIRLDPTYAEAYNNLGVAYGNKGLLDEAIDQFRAALRLNPGLADAHNNLGLANGKKGKMAEAVEECKISIGLQPDNPEAYNNLGIILGMQGAYDQAAEQFKKAISLQPNNPKYSYNLANAYRQKLQGT